MGALKHIRSAVMDATTDADRDAALLQFTDALREDYRDTLTLRLERLLHLCELCQVPQVHFGVRLAVEEILRDEC